MDRSEIIEAACRAWWDAPRRDGSKASVPWDDPYVKESWKEKYRDQMESSLRAVGAIS